ncbi:uncharacterized protein LOC133180678 [Saccostrea echinata]|uniref:uncharacterized protein LOC133180678 n=1 Tax=Saccostrea echinata TaxID=191078 RepID=UPI002A7F4E52|nr:uncharacterized protein LOC133180678 [Saccostrea echinata]
MCIIHGILKFLLLGYVPGIVCYTIDVETTNCDPPLSRNASSVAQVIYIKPSAKISCTWTILIDGDNCLEIYYSNGADLLGAFLEIEADNEREIQPFVNTSVCSVHQVTIYYRHNMTDGRVSGTDVYLHYLSVPERGHTVLNDLGTTTTSVGSTEKSGGSSPGVIAVAVIIPILIIGIGAIVAYVWYRRKYPVRMIVGKDFAKFSNPAYNKRASTATLVRENAALDDYQKDIEEGAAYTGVSHDNPALNMEDDPQYQPIPALTHSVVYSNYRRSFEDSPDLGKRAPEKPRRLHSNNESKSDSIESAEENKNSQTTAGISHDSVFSTYDSVDSEEKDSPLYENVENNSNDKINVDKSVKVTSHRVRDDDMSQHEIHLGEISQEYEDVSPTATEDEHTYDTALHSSINSSLKDTPIKDSKEVSEDTSVDDFQVYENVSLGEEAIKDEQKNSIADGNSEKLSQNDSSSEKNEAEGDVLDFPHSPVTRDSFQESFSSESFVVLDQSDSAELEVKKTENEAEQTDQISTQESQSSDEEEHLDDVKEEAIDPSETLPDKGQSQDKGDTVSPQDAEVDPKDAEVDQKDAEVDRSFDMDVNNLDISVSSISDPDGKSFDSAFSFVSHDFKSKDESSDSFEVISHEQASAFADNVKDNVSDDSLEQTAKIIEDKIHEDSKPTDSEHEQHSTVSKTIKPDLNISFHDSSESESVNDEEDAPTAEIEKMVDSNKERRESVTRKIAIDHGSISFDDSSDSSHSDEEKPKPGVLRRESITLDNPTFDSPNINISLKFSSDKTVDKPEQPRGLTRRKSITLDNPLFEKDSEISTEPEASPLDDFQVIEAGPSEGTISEESENEAEDIENVPTSQKKVLKINMDFGKDEDSDDDGIASSVPSGKESNSETESSTEA